MLILVTCLDCNIFCTTGMEKAAVFPDPVLALANMSFPSNASGMAFSCIGVGVPHPKVAIALKIEMV